MGLSKPRTAVKEERVVRLTRHFGDRERSRVGKAVSVADDELVERVARVEASIVVGLGGGCLGCPLRCDYRDLRGDMRASRRMSQRRAVALGHPTAGVVGRA